jgi:hypothetical protein
MRWLLLMLWMPAAASAAEPALRSEFTVFPAVVQFNDKFVDQTAASAVWSWHVAERFAVTIAGSAAWDARESSLESNLVAVARVESRESPSSLTAWTALGGIELTTGDGTFEVFEHGPLRVRALFGVGLGARGNRALLGSGSFAEAGTSLMAEARAGLRFALTPKVGIAVQVADGVSSYDAHRLNGCDGVDLKALADAQAAGKATWVVVSSPCRPAAFTRPGDLSFAKNLASGVPYVRTVPSGIVNLATFAVGLYGVF